MNERDTCADERIRRSSATVGELTASCVNHPSRTIELFDSIDLAALLIEDEVRAYHAYTTALWYTDRNRGREALREMWRRHAESGLLFTPEIAEHLAHYGETWESLLGHEDPTDDLEASLARPILRREELQRRKRDSVRPQTRPSLSEPPPASSSADITVVVTSCRRVHLFERTIDSFLACCSDLDQVVRWLCIDDGSSDEDRSRMRDRYPWFEYVWKSPDQRGHVRSLQLAASMLETDLVFLLEDDHEFFVRSDYLSRCRIGLEVSPKAAQCLVNLNYAETLDDFDLAGGMPFQHDGRAYVAQLYDPDGTVVPPPSNAHWPHFSLRPGLTRRAVWDLGFRDVPFFERDLAWRATEAGWFTIFLPCIHHRHIGKLTTERGANAYTLNRTPQF
jgi:hypothetical protein